MQITTQENDAFPFARRALDGLKKLHSDNHRETKDAQKLVDLFGKERA